MPEIARGTLGPIRLASVLQLAETEVFTGRLALEAGEVRFVRGGIRAVRCGELVGVAALCELFIGETGEFSLVAEEVEAGPLVGALLALIIEGCRLADEWARVAPQWLRPSAELKAQGPAEAALLARLDGSRTVEEALVGPRAPMVDFILAALERGLLQEVPAAERPPRAPTPTPAPPRGSAGPQVPSAPASGTLAGELDYDAAMDLGRRLTREGSWAQAVLAFERALVARPGDRIASQNLRRVEQARAGGVERSAFQWFRRG